MATDMFTFVRESSNRVSNCETSYLYNFYCPITFMQILDYCDWTLYWTAYWSLALHLTAFALTIAAVFVILMYGSLANTTE